jgi:hypothetical protein
MIIKNLNNDMIKCIKTKVEWNGLKILSLSIIFR